MTFSVEEIKDLMSKMKETGLGELDFQQGDTRLQLSAKKTRMVTAAPTAVAPMMAAPMVEMETTTEGAALQPTGTPLKAPIVGTFYSAPAPDKDPFVSVGKQVKKGDVLYIIESMKLMNEVQAEQDGEISEILVKNGDAVEFDQTVMLMK